MDFLVQEPLAALPAIRRSQAVAPPPMKTRTFFKLKPPTRFLGDLEVFHHPEEEFGMVNREAWWRQLLRIYDRFDPVFAQALGHPEPFEWGLEIGSRIGGRTLTAAISLRKNGLKKRSPN